MNLQKVIVIPVEVYNNMKKLILNDDDISSFDKEMKLILHDKKLSDSEKWEVYREKLIHYGEKLQKSLSENDDKLNIKKIIHVESTPTQTKRVFSKDKATSSDISQSIGCTQTDLENHQIIPPIESVFESTNFYDSLREDISGHNLSSSFHDNSVQNKAHISPSKTVKRKIKSSHSDVDLYEMVNGDIVTVVKKEKKDDSSSTQKAKKFVSAKSSAKSLKQQQKQRKIEISSTPIKKLCWENLY